MVLRKTSVCLLALLLSLPIVAAASAQAATGTDEAPTLWFRPSNIQQLQHNLTTFAPNQTTPLELEAGIQSYDEGRRWLFQTAIPATWTVDPDTPWRVSLVFEDLDQMVPLPDGRFIFDGRDPDASEGLVVYLAAKGADSSLVAEGHTAIPLEDLVMQTRHVVEFDVQVLAAERFGTTDGAAQRLVTTVGIMGRYADGVLPAEDEPKLLLLGTDAASSITLPGFPVEEFRAWETAEVIEATCQPYDLQGLPCPARVGADNETEQTKEGTGLGIPAVLLMLVAGLAIVTATARRWR